MATATQNEKAKLDNRFLKNGIAMIVDWYNAKEIYELMERELNSLMDRHNAGQKFLRAMAIQSPVFEMTVTLIIHLQILMSIDDPSTNVQVLAAALMTTFYGLILANLLLIPLATKLSHRTESEEKLFRAIRVGAIGIHDLANPQRIQRNMNALLPPLDQRE